MIEQLITQLLKNNNLPTFVYIPITGVDLVDVKEELVLGYELSGFGKSGTMLIYEDPNTNKVYGRCRYETYYEIDELQEIYDIQDRWINNKYG